MDTHDNPYDENDDLTISDNSMRFLRETGGWGQMLAIIGFCLVGFMVLGGLFMGSLMSSFGGDELPFPSYMIGVLYIIIAVIYFFPILYLYKFSTHIKSALKERDASLIEIAFENQKSLYKFMGIFTIISLAFYVIGGIGLIFMGSFLS